MEASVRLLILFNPEKGSRNSSTCSLTYTSKYLCSQVSEGKNYSNAWQRYFLLSLWNQTTCIKRLHENDCLKHYFARQMKNWNKWTDNQWIEIRQKTGLPSCWLIGPRLSSSLRWSRQIKRSEKVVIIKLLCNLDTEYSAVAISCIIGHQLHQFLSSIATLSDQCYLQVVATNLSWHLISISTDFKIEITWNKMLKQAQLVFRWQFHSNERESV